MGADRDQPPLLGGDEGDPARCHRTTPTARRSRHSLTSKEIGDGASPSSSIGDEMFRPRSGPKPGLGIAKLRFFSPRLFGGTIYHAIPNTFYCSMKWFPLIR